MNYLVSKTEFPVLIIHIITTTTAAIILGMISGVAIVLRFLLNQESDIGIERAILCILLLVVLVIVID